MDSTNENSTDAEDTNDNSAGAGDAGADSEEAEDSGLKYEAVEDMYMIDLNGKGYFTIYTAVRDTNGNTVGKKAATNQAPTTTFAETSSGSGKYTVPTGTIAADTKTLDVYNIQNIDSRSRKVVLRKVDGASYSPLGDANTDKKNPTEKQAQFTVYYADKQTVVKGKTTDSSGAEIVETLEKLLSDASGTIWIGKLPFGTYYLHETKVPNSYKPLSTAGNWFVLTVNEDGVGYAKDGEAEFTNSLNPLAEIP